MKFLYVSKAKFNASTSAKFRLKLKISLGLLIYPEHYASTIEKA